MKRHPHNGADVVGADSFDSIDSTGSLSIDLGAMARRNTRRIVTNPEVSMVTTRSNARSMTRCRRSGLNNSTEGRTPTPPGIVFSFLSLLVAVGSVLSYCNQSAERKGAVRPCTNWNKNIEQGRRKSESDCHSSSSRCKGRGAKTRTVVEFGQQT